MVPSAGATMDDDTGEMKVKADTTSVVIHFLRIGQFLGFSGSSGPFHVTFVSVALAYAAWNAKQLWIDECVSDT